MTTLEQAIRAVIVSDLDDMWHEIGTKVSERLDALEKVTMTDEQVRRIVGTALVDHMVEAHAGEDERLDDLEEKVGKLEAATTEPAACPVCGCYADHDVQCRLRPKPEPAAPKPASTLVAQVRDRVIDPMYRAMVGPGFRDYLPPTWRGTNAYTEDAIREFAAWLDAEAGRRTEQCEYATADRYARTARHVRAQLEP